MCFYCKCCPNEILFHVEGFLSGFSPSLSPDDPWILVIFSSDVLHDTTDLVLNSVFILYKINKLLK